MTSRLLAEGDGWRVEEMICRAGPDAPAFEERHGWTAIAAVLSGVFTYRTFAGRAMMAPGALLLGEPGRCYACGHEHGVGDRCLSLHLSPGFVEDALRDLKGVRREAFARPSLPPLDRLTPLVAEAQALAAAPDPLAAEQLCLGLATAAFALSHDTHPISPSAAEDTRAGQAVRIIERRFAEPLTIAGLAAEVGLSRRRFATAFRRAVGVSPYAYILARRLDAAAQMLRAGQASVLAAALDAGFGDLSEFTRRFASRFGVPPGRYARSAGARR
jgi:AraC-like DNA-binding protein